MGARIRGRGWLCHGVAMYCRGMADRRESGSSLRALVVVATVASFGCGAPRSPMMGPCRDPATGRFVSCGSGSDSSSGDTALAVGLGLGAAALIGLGLWAASAMMRPSTPQEQHIERVCADIEGRTVNVCDAEAGYRFALPTPCPPRSTQVGTLALNCDAARSPSYHACIRDDGAWRTVPSWEACGAGHRQADGAWVQPGQAPTAPLTSGFGLAAP